MKDRDSNDFNPWKAAMLGIGGVVALAVMAGFVVANYDSLSAPTTVDEQAAAPPPKEKAPKVATAGDAPAASRPRAADIEDCNAYASGARNQTEEAVKGAVIGGAVGAGAGAAGGAIAKGGKGAGKGAGIGAIVGATVGTLYGLNQANQANAQAEAAYRACMARRGYSG
jgi:hypothetical protein